jgi:hypothetical protein
MKIILDDRLLRLRLGDRPEFQLRLAEFVQSYGIAGKPALVLQARPAPDAKEGLASLDDPELQDRFRVGVHTDRSWWDGFRSMTAVIPTFHGIASLPGRDQPTWAAEVHRDGHFIAGIWRFPEFSINGSKVLALADFYAEIFKDFFQLVTATVQGDKVHPKYEATFTLVHAPKLHYATRSDLGGQYIVRDALTIEHLQWPTATAAVGTPKWMLLAEMMSKSLTGAYRDIPRER